tara:strand:- start:229 stop:552 length:324 start_codon:yes stop_codon:yes gene_type:complete
MPIKKKTFNKSSNLSKSNDKRGELLVKVDSLMEKLDNEYGPFLLDELQRRLESTIGEFHDDLKMILEKTFKNHEMKIKGQMNYSEDEESPDVPTFIAEYEEKKKKKK